MVTGADNTTGWPFDNRKGELSLCGERCPLQNQDQVSDSHTWRLEIHLFLQHPTEDQFTTVWPGAANCSLLVTEDNGFYNVCCQMGIQFQVVNIGSVVTFVITWRGSRRVQRSWLWGNYFLKRLPMWESASLWIQNCVSQEKQYYPVCLH